MDHDEMISTIRPSSPSLASQLQALDILAARLQTLTEATRWPARVPLNSKATFEGQIVHTNDVKVNIGGGYWVAMTAVEAAEWVKRRKHELLIEHMRRIEGSNVISSPAFGSSSAKVASGSGRTIPMPPPIHLNPVLKYPIAGSSKPRAASPPAQLPTGQTTGRLDPVVEPREQEDDEVDSPGAGPSKDQDLTGVIEKFIDAQRLQATSKSGADDASATVNEEGLPIHEIREGLDGTTLGDPPPPNTNGVEMLASDREVREDYWSEAAKARRAALRRKVFNEGSDSDSDVDPPQKTSSVPPKPQPSSIIPASSSDLPSPSSPRQSTSSSTTPLPKSILKSQPRKKSVSFDQSVPIPPDSPETTIKAGKMGFPMPVHDVSEGKEYGEFEPAPIPTLNQPIVPRRKENGFAGFKPGFLSSKPSSTVSSASAGNGSSGESSKPKTSLFAQRRAAKTDGESAMNNSSSATTKGSNRPKMSSHQMTSMKNTVVEKITPGPASGASSSYGAQGTITPPDASSHSLDEVEDEIDDDDDDDDDEYDLDDALLAREVALDYHRRQVPLRHRSESDEEYEDPNEEGGGGVMLALPSVSNGKIVNPTPEELRKYVRVGRLENGNLVLAPGEKGWSDDEDGEARANREEVKRQLLGQDVSGSARSSRSPSDGRSTQPAKPQVKETPPRVTPDPGPPPTVRTVSESKPSLQAGPSGPEPKEVPQKMSRFKAARLGLDN